MNRFEYTDGSGDKLVVLPAQSGILVEAENAPHIPLERVEEVIAGIRDMARQAAYAVAYHQPARFPGDSAAMRAAALSAGSQQ